MEWVETTGRTVEEAVDAALDQLGVDASDAEYEVLEEPRVGLFGRLRTEARVRARVRPTTPRPKEERRGRSRKAAAKPVRAAKTAAPDPEATQTSVPSASAEAIDTPVAAAAGRPPKEGGPPMTETEAEVPLQEQGEVAMRFLRGVLERFGAPQAEVTLHEIDDDTIELRVEGDDLGLLIGQKGAALQSLQELTRTVVQRQSGARTGRILVDVSGYRERRREALQRFAQKVADDVRAAGTRIVLEPMNPSDRKVIHDTINEIDGVATSSEGEEPRRRVVVAPA